MLYPLQDGNANVTALITKAAGSTWEVAERYDYDPYGQPTYRDPEEPHAERSESAYGFDVLYAGYHYDRETGLYHVRRRMLHPTLGVWLTPDPQGYADGPNLYQYCGSSPVSAIDPMGDVFLLAGLLASGAVSGVTSRKRMRPPPSTKHTRGPSAWTRVTR